MVEILVGNGFCYDHGRKLFCFDHGRKYLFATMVAKMFLRPWSQMCFCDHGLSGGCDHGLGGGRDHGRSKPAVLRILEFIEFDAHLQNPDQHLRPWSRWAVSYIKTCVNS